MAVTTRDAVTLARDWVTSEARNKDGFMAAYLAGSLNRQDDMSVLRPSTDVDIHILQEGSAQWERMTVCKGVTLQVALRELSSYCTHEQILAHPFESYNLTFGKLLYDPYGFLGRFQVALRPEWARKSWVLTRCYAELCLAKQRFSRAALGTSLIQSSMAWIMGIQALSGILANAWLRPPTYRRCLLMMHQDVALASQEEIFAQGRNDLIEMVLQLAGWNRMSRSQVINLLERVARCFNNVAAAGARPASPPFQAMICDGFRPMAIDGSREMIDEGYHREAMFWIHFITSILVEILATREGVQERVYADQVWRDLLESTGFSSSSLQARSALVTEVCENTIRLAEAICHRKYS